MEEKQREKWADIVKGVAIWMMVFCHAHLSHEGLMNFIYIFHMPVFFIISGYFDKGEMLSYRTLKKSLYSLIRPYFIYSLLSFSICWISPYLHPEIYTGIHGLLPTFRAAFWGMLLMDDTVTTYSFMPSGPLWFLVALFVVKLIWMSFVSFFKKRSYIGLFLSLSILFAIVYFRPNYFSLDSAILALPYYIFGFVLSHYRIIECYKQNKKSLALFVFISLAYLLTLGMYNGRVDIDGFVYGNNIFCFYLNGLIGSLFCICISFFLQKYDSFISVVGRNSLTILGLHSFFCVFSKVLAVGLLGIEASSFPILFSFLVAALACVCIVEIKSIHFLGWLP